MPERTVRFTDDFFDDLDRQLPAERTPAGVSSVSDFLVFELPPLRDLLAADFERNTLPIEAAAPLRVLIQAARLVRNVALYAFDDGRAVVVVGIDVELRGSEDDPS